MPSNPHAATDCALDEWTRRIVDVHFDPEHGTPYWLDWADEHGVDVRSEVEAFDDLKHVFEPFDGAVLREIDVSRFAPQSLSGPRRVYETGGTTGAPKRVVMVDYWRQQAAWASRVLGVDDFPRGNLLMLGPPGGANNAGVFVRHLADEWGTLAYFVNMDPRWAKRLSKRRDTGEFEAYVDHLLDQAERVLTTQDVTVLFTTARLLERPRVRDLTVEHGVEAVYHGGTALDPGTYRHFRESWYADIAFAGEYGNTLMGVAQEVPTSVRPADERGYRPVYVPCHPCFVPEVVNDRGEVVGYGERGRIRPTVLTEELFIPLLDERDEATRLAGEEPYPWDWIGTPESGTDTKDAVEGVY